MAITIPAIQQYNNLTMKQKIIQLISLTILAPLLTVTAYAVDQNNPFGTITNPLPTGGSLGPGGGLITLLNNILRLIFVISGIYAFIRVITAGFGFINAGGDAKKIEQSWNSIWQSLLGVVIVISSIAVAALMGLLFFGEATAILNPKVFGPGTP